MAPEVATPQPQWTGQSQSEHAQPPVTAYGTVTAPTHPSNLSCAMKDPRTIPSNAKRSPQTQKKGGGKKTGKRCGVGGWSGPSARESTAVVQLLRHQLDPANAANQLSPALVYHLRCSILRANQRAAGGALCRSWGLRRRRHLREPPPTLDNRQYPVSARGRRSASARLPLSTSKLAPAEP